MLRNPFMPTIILLTRIEKKLAHYWITSFIIPKHLEVIYFQVKCSLTLVIILANFLTLGPKQTRKERKNLQIFSDANKSKFKENLSKIDWTNELKPKTVDEAMSFFYQTITKACDKSFPIVKLSRKHAIKTSLGLHQVSKVV